MKVNIETVRVHANNRAYMEVAMTQVLKVSMHGMGFLPL